MAEKPSQRITTVSNKINVQQYMCVCLYASGNYRVNVLSEWGTGLEMWWCLHTIRMENRTRDVVVSTYYQNGEHD